MLLNHDQQINTGYHSGNLFYIMYFNYPYLHNIHLTTFTLFIQELSSQFACAWKAQ
jgi:hypothetical protein